MFIGADLLNSVYAMSFEELGHKTRILIRILLISVEGAKNLFGAIILINLFIKLKRSTKIYFFSVI